MLLKGSGKRDEQKPKGIDEVELLAPAGNIEKARVAISYGASAIYLAGKLFGLRNAASNFSLLELDEIISYAHSNGARVYLVLNSFLYNDEIDEIISYIKELRNLAIDAIIVSDIGVFSLVKELTDFDIHFSTQASVCHIEALRFWKSMGVKRVVLAREVSISEAIDIKRNCDIELEVFVHGSMCMSYSGKCVISNYTADRDANRGGCVNSCRWEYDIKDKPSSEGVLSNSSYVMNSKDLWSIDLIHTMIRGGISSFKIEGRMKSSFYLASVVRVYREIIDNYLSGRKVTVKLRERWKSILYNLPNRGYSTAFLEDIDKSSSLAYERLSLSEQSSFIGIVNLVELDFIGIEVRTSFSIGDTLLFYLFNGDVFSIPIDKIYDIAWSEIDRAGINSVVFLKKKSPYIQPFNVVSVARLL